MTNILNQNCRDLAWDYPGVEVQVKSFIPKLCLLLYW